MVRGTAAVDAAIEGTRGFLATLLTTVGEVQARGGVLEEAFTAAHDALVGQYGQWAIFQHCLPFDVARVWDELSGIERPVIWTPERDRALWARLQG
ncbi:hypothetical protein [Gordonia desulfuricans]|uniref:hypothetical protein n=1 Tax=Gordonia desulfuricans TaxID=89051 RepID=UPI000AEB5285|nr:hypothetical protein [Gordonia desulfuricans]